MIDARNIYRKVTRKIYDFSPEQLQNLTAIVWLYRGQSDRFIALVQKYLARTITEAAAIADQTGAFRKTYDELTAATTPFLKTLPKDSPLRDLLKERDEAAKACFQVLDKWTARIAKDWKRPGEKKLTAQKKLLAELDTPRRRAATWSRISTWSTSWLPAWWTPRKRMPVPASMKRGMAGPSAGWRRIWTQNARRPLNSLKPPSTSTARPTGFFPASLTRNSHPCPVSSGSLAPAPRSCRRLESHRPGRYVGVAPPEVDEDFDFEQALRDIHVELADLNQEAAGLAAKIQENFKELSK